MTELGLCVSHLADGEEVSAVALLRGTGLCRDCCVENAKEEVSALDAIAEDARRMQDHLRAAQEKISGAFRRE